MSGTAPDQGRSWQLAAVAAVVTETPRATSLVLELPRWPGHRAGQHGLLVGELGRTVAAGGRLDPDYRHDDVPGHAGPLAGPLQVPCGGGEELGGRALLVARAGDDVDDGTGAGERPGEAVPGDDVDAGRPGDRYDLGREWAKQRI